LFPKFISQNRAIKKFFYQKIVDRNNNLSPEEQDRIKRNVRIGTRGEFAVKCAFLLGFPRRFIVLNDIVLEVSPMQSIQIDHLVLCPFGIFVVETKTWKGTYDIDETNEWRINGKKTFKNPIEQNTEHVEGLKIWLKDNFKEEPHLQTRIFPLHIIEKGEIGKNLGSSECVQGGWNAVRRILANAGKNFSDQVLQELAKRIKHAPPLDSWKWVRQNYPGLKDIRTVTIPGTKREAVTVLKIYESKGLKVEYPMKQLDTDGQLWQLNIKNHVEYVEEVAQKRIARIRLESTSILKQVFSPQFFKYIRVPATLIILTIIVLHYSSNIKSSITSVQQSINDQMNSIKTSVTTTPKESPLGLMTFNVEGGSTYINIFDGNKALVEKIFKKGSKIEFFQKTDCQAKCDTSSQKASCADFQPKHLRGRLLIS